MQAHFQALIEAAVQARQRAYAPYSKFSVGAALLAETGEIVAGCNVENASYGLTICAERNAVFAAVAQGLTQFRAIAISLEKSGAPCGACRQVLHEFAPDLTILMANEAGQSLRKMTLKDLLPHAFGPENLS